MLVVDVPHDTVTSIATPSVHTPLNEQHQLNDGHAVDQNDAISSDSSPSPTCSEHVNCGRDPISVRLDISFKSPSHTGLRTTELVYISIYFSIICLSFLLLIEMCRSLIINCLVAKKKGLCSSF